LRQYLGPLDGVALGIRCNLQQPCRPVRRRIRIPGRPGGTDGTKQRVVTAWPHPVGPLERGPGFPVALLDRQPCRNRRQMEGAGKRALVEALVEGGFVDGFGS
jgi:hypothetical protein